MIEGTFSGFYVDANIVQDCSVSYLFRVLFSVLYYSKNSLTGGTIAFHLFMTCVPCLRNILRSFISNRFYEIRKANVANKDYIKNTVIR